MDVEQRARELLAAEYEARGELVHAMNIGRGGLSVMYAAEIAAIAKALTPPEGYVLVKKETLSELAADAEGYAHLMEHRQDRLKQKLLPVHEVRSLIAASKEVGDGR